MLAGRWQGERSAIRARVWASVSSGSVLKPRPPSGPASGAALPARVSPRQGVWEGSAVFAGAFGACSQVASCGRGSDGALP
eukprot:267393-Lingulodinium_polyedra.AAC.1